MSLQHPFDSLAGEYAQLWRTMAVSQSRMGEVTQVASRLLQSKARYAAVTAKTGVPVAVLAALHERESTANFHTYLGNGEPLNRVTRLVPKGRGPFAEPGAWEAGADDALHLDHLDQVSPWSIERALYESELWNGFGPRNHGKHSGYVWAGSNIYTGGKYVSDGVWNLDYMDTQIGTAPLMRAMMAIDPSLAMPTMLKAVSVADVPIVPAASPAGVGAPISGHGIRWLQAALNNLDHAEIVIDGSYGRCTKLAVLAFQKSHGLDADGIAGPKTYAALDAALAKAP